MNKINNFVTKEHTVIIKRKALWKSMFAMYADMFTTQK